MRLAHFLKGNKGNETPQSAIWLDTETEQRRLSRDTVEHVLRFGWACHSRRLSGGAWCDPEWVRYVSSQTLWAWVDAHVRPKVRTYVFAHNWGFDAPVTKLFEELPRRGWRLQRAVIESPPVWLVWRRGSSTLVMLDSLNWWRVPLAVLGHSLGYEKLRMPASRASAARWDTYCRRDVTIIQAALTRWWGFLIAHDLGGFAPTLAGQAMRSYRHRFMQERILCDDNPLALRIARDAYHGGRTECFRIGRVAGPVAVLDVNSQYPYAMHEQAYPAALVGTTSDAQVRDLREWLRGHCVVARVDIDTDEPAYGHVHGGRLCFPVGHFTTSLCTPDLEYALAHRHVKRVHEVAVYSRAPLFREFVAEMYSHRLKAKSAGDAVTTEFFKILMNSLYGKFGQRGGKWVEVGETESDEVRVWMELDADTGRVIHYRQFARVVQSMEGDEEARDSHPAIAAHVTAYARRQLWNLILLAGRSHVVYCDTDSLWVDAVGARRLRRLVHPTRLGALKVEAVHRWVLLHGCKDYRTPKFRKTKGVRRTAVWTSPHSVTQEQWTSLVGLLRTGQLSAPRTTTISKTLSRQYSKGHVSRSGIVTPLTLSEW